MHFRASIFAIATLAACAPAGPKLEATTPRIVISGASGVHFYSAVGMAQAECEAFGLHAEFVPDDVPDGQATFICVPFASEETIPLPEGPV